MCLSLFIGHAFSYWPIYLSTLVCLAQLGDSMEAGLSLGRILWTQGRGGDYLCPPLGSTGSTPSHMHGVAHHPYLLSFGLVTSKFLAPR